MAFASGDLVQLKSGGPTMTVQYVSDLGVEDTRCCWFVGYDLKRCDFAADSLTKVEPSRQQGVNVVR